MWEGTGYQSWAKSYRRYPHLAPVSYVGRVENYAAFVRSLVIMANIEEKGTPGRETAGAEVPSSTPQPSELHTWTPKTALMSRSGHFGSENGHPPSPSFPRTVDLLGLEGDAAGTDGDATAGASNASMEVKLSTVTPSSSTALVAAAAAAADPFAGLALMEVSTSQTLGARGSSWPLYSQGVRCSES